MLNLLQYDDYRSYLKDELVRRVQENPRYSLRAFARDLKVSPQRLSFILNRKKGLSGDAAALIAYKLGLSDEEKSFFCDMVALAHVKSQEAKKMIALRMQKSRGGPNRYQTLALEAFRVISDWYHYALLELTTTKNFKSDVNWIARRLGISVHEVKQAIERLKALDLLEETASGKLKQTGENLTTTHDIPSDAIRSFNKQILTKALEALSQQTVEERDFTTITVSTSPRQLKKAKELIRDFRRSLAEHLESGDKTEVYTFSMQLFRLTNQIGEKK